MSFASLGLSEALQRAVSEQGYEEPTPIQRQAIPAVLAGGDLLAGAQTGTGKTAGFVAADAAAAVHATAPAVAGARSTRKPIRALILTPTRELAAQVEESVRTYGKHLTLNSMVIFGGVGINPQIHAAASAASTSWSPPPAACSITRARATSTCRGSRSSCSTRPTACSTWASSPTSSG